MARIDDLIGLVEDAALRRELQAAATELKRQRRFGLVFEEHIPETTALLGHPIRPGLTVQCRNDPGAKSLYRVLDVQDDLVSMTGLDGKSATQTCSVNDLLVVQRLGEPVFPALNSVGKVEYGGDRPFHAVINGENYHALQLLLYLYEGQVDALYLDPPYNTGAKDCKYNNSYVDENDQWRHSKWLSFMDRRLRLARRLLKSDGVLIVTIDEHEVAHIGVLLEQIFPDFLRYQITIVINPKGTYKANFARVEEYAYFCVPNTGREIISGKPVQAALPQGSGDTIEEELGDEGEADEDEDDDDDQPAAQTDQYEFWHLRRRGEESSYRDQRPNQFYAILVDEARKAVVGIGPHLEKEDPYEIVRQDGILTVYPIDKEGNERVWRYARDTMQGYIDAGEIVVGRFNSRQDIYTLNHRKLSKSVTRLKTVWAETEYDAGVHGTNVVKAFLGKRGLFPFPKSVYAVRDCLAAVCRDRPDALIVDFFAGSGTTLHATALLNAEDDGHRRCVLVTNNEVGPKVARRLNRQGLYRGDPGFEAHGIFEEVTRPRVEAVITGRRPDGSEVPGRHGRGRRGRPFAQGFPENVEFFRLEYLDPDEVDLGLRLDALLPALWLAAGGIGNRELPCPEHAYSLPLGSTYGLLLRPARFRQFKEAVEQRPDVTHVYLVTDSDEAFLEMRAALPRGLTATQLYGDYLRRMRSDMGRYR